MMESNPLLQLVLATDNLGKRKEFTELLQNDPIELLTQSQFNLMTPPETGKTFIENALLKARFVATHTKLPTLSDDSGLVVPLLNGEPGIYSSRYAGENANAEDNIHYLLSKLKAFSSQTIPAYFYCIIIVITHTDDPTPLISQGKWEGEISLSKKGSNGFGYDPIFWVPSENKTAAELSKEIKNRISHRAQAFHHLKKNLLEKLRT